MKKVLDQLRSAAQSPVSHNRVDVSKVLMEVRSHCADREPVPHLESIPGAVIVDMDREKLASVLTHIIRNAQDATPAEGRIEVALEAAAGGLVITVSDTGQGMDSAFVRDRLFRPFDSTKGAKGMGIGAYQVRETVRATGGDVEVESTPGSGTRFRVRLPLVGGRDPLLMDKPAA
jgi:signal transduction histidine kinase